MDKPHITKEEFFELVRVQREKLALQEREAEARRRAMCVQKIELVDKAWYLGTCRNGTLAQWHADKQQFTYTRTKFGNTFLEDINHFDDDDGYDVFYPQKRVDGEQM